MTRGVHSAPETAIKRFDVASIRRDFPILATMVHGNPLTYLDNAATTQKPHAVIEVEAAYYRTVNANVHRGVHFLSEQATAEYERVRGAVRERINAASTQEIVFVRGTTEAINLVASSYGAHHVGPGDEVLITGLEHHSNIVPWQMLCGRVGGTLRVVPLNDDGELMMDEFSRMLTAKTKLVAVSHISNALGTVNPVKTMISMAHDRGIPVLVDGAQAMAHRTVDVTDLDADFYAFSGHKMFGPTGIGVLYGKESYLEAMPPYQGGGDMIKSVTFEKTVYNDLPYKFEAGTPNIAGVIGLGAAIEYLGSIDVHALEAHESELLEAATTMLQEIDGVRLIGTARERSGVVSFVVRDAHPHDVGTIVDREGVAVRTGHHCAQPVMDRFHVPATVRASFAMYNTRDDIGRLRAGLEKAMEVLGS